MKRQPVFREFVYLEDEQGYCHSHVKMVLDVGKHVTVEVLEWLSWEPDKAGRFATCAEELVEIAAKHGMKLRIVERREKLEKVPDEWANLPLATGATGNY